MKVIKVALSGLIDIAAILVAAYGVLMIIAGGEYFWGSNVIFSGIGSIVCLRRRMYPDSAEAPKIWRLNVY